MENEEKTNLEDLDLGTEFSGPSEEVPELDLNQEVEEAEIFAFLDKKTLVGKVTKVKVKGLYNSKFKSKDGKYKKLIGLDIAGKEYRLDLNKSNQNFLVKVFGKIPAAWIGREFYVSAQETEYDTDSGEKRKGYSVQFSN